MSNRIKARIIKSARREFDCALEGLNQVVQATALGNLLKEGEVVVGDFVELSKQNNEYIIEKVFERKNSIYRNLVREKTQKVIAANLDVLVCVTAISKPEFKRGMVDRYLLRSQQWDIPAILVFNKTDEYAEQIDIPFECERLKELGVQCFEISAKFPEYKNKFIEQGLSELKKFLNNKTAIFLGQSGVGKSKLISTLTDGEVELESQKLAKVGKGAHTTTWAELITHKDLNIIDSPGVRTLSIDDLTVEQLDDYTPDIAELATQCQFNNCQHQENSKGCIFFTDKFKNDSFVQSRLESYLRFKEEIERIPHWKK
ncbi:MAG: ribosome small subunit-dependent GTPase A [Halobacteriovoraceae bacterium]|nr:ribosome small subunit-dependent GTPase A [Halobacteriovoraceae bacterium]MCB9095404.1 ribosome small subunit-dependent GTPase A [Halobacteriovoraceae bacterium]